MKCTKCGADLENGQTTCPFCRNVMPSNETTLQKPTVNNIDQSLEQTTISEPQSTVQEQVQQPVNNIQMQPEQVQTKKKKFRWYIPVLLLFGPIILSVSVSLIGLLVFNVDLDKKLNLLYTIIKLICWLAFLPSIIFEIIRINKK